MRRWGALFATLLIISPVYSFASSLGCYQVAGEAIFGYDGRKWEYIGAISNEYDSNSIANEYGAGSEYKSESIFNEYGSYGSEYSSESAFNEYASNPPIIVDSDYDLIGYLTINEYKYPSISPYKALACAKDTYSSSDSDMEDVTFKKIPGQASGSASYTSYSAPQVSSSQNAPYVAPTPTCPANASVVNGACSCNAGYAAEGSSCVTETVACQKLNGPYSYGSNMKCYCSTGYKYDSATRQCVVDTSVAQADNAVREGVQSGEYFNCPNSPYKFKTSSLCNENHRPVCINGSIQCQPDPGWKPNADVIVPKAVASDAPATNAIAPVVKSVVSVEAKTEESKKVSNAVSQLSETTESEISPSTSTPATAKKSLFARIWLQLFSWFK